MAAAVAPEKLVFVDECGLHTSLAQIYGYAPRGERLRFSVPRTRGRNTTLLAMDNLGAHRPKRIRELIEGRGCELIYLPAYSPDYSPIEEAFSKIKGLLRRAAARTKGALVEAMGVALSEVRAADARGFFEHAGYRPSVQLP